MLRCCLIVSVILLGITIIPAQQAKQASSDAPLTSDQWKAHKITSPELISGGLREYPVEARFQLLDGLCMLSVVVNTQGNPENAHLLHCTDPSFEETSLDAAKQYRFRPAVTQDGKPVAVKISILHHDPIARYSLSLRSLVNWPVVPDKRLILDRHSSKAEIRRDISQPIRFSFIQQQGGTSVPAPDGVYPYTRSVAGPRFVRFSDKGYGSIAFAHVDSLLNSNYEPGFVHEKEVPMRGLVHLSSGNAQNPLPTPPA